MKAVSVVIVNRNTRDLLKNCLESLPTGFAEIPYDVWIVDNASDDGSSEMVSKDYPNTKLICNAENVGFGKANNQVLIKTETPFVLLLNSDTILTKNCVCQLYNFLIDHPEAAIVGPKLVNQEGKLQPSTYPLPNLWTELLFNLKIHKLFPKKKQSRLLLGSFWDHASTRKVGRITGACILVRMDDLWRVNLLDEAFFFYGEVHDLCWSLWKMRREIWFHSNSVVIHLGGQTSKQMWDYKEQRRRMWRENEKLLRKHQTLNVIRLNIFLNWFTFLLAILKENTVSFVVNKSSDKSLLTVDFEWYSRRLKEWFWIRFKHLFDFYFQMPSYSIRFQKKLIRKFNINNLSAFEFKGEIDLIKEKLIDKWKRAQNTSARTGFMDFSCAAILYQIVRMFRPQIVVETGVANGISSTFILSAMEANAMGELYSIDWSDNEESSFVQKDKEIGWMVPDELRKRWYLQIGRSEDKLEPLLKQINEIDIFIHDSDHSYETMMYEYKSAWPHLKGNGILLSDDVRMNTAFDEFTKDNKCPALVYKARLGIAQKRG